MPYTFPNQRIITVHRESAKSNFLGIKNDNWQAAACDLGAHALMLYLYIASNANGYVLALSPVAVRQAIGMARSTYHDQFHKLVDKGYLVPASGNTFEFYEVPQSVEQTQEALSDVGLNFEESPSDNKQVNSDGYPVMHEDIEINKMENKTDNEKNNLQGDGIIKIQKTQVKEIVINQPKAEGKKRPVPKESDFTF